jgi:glycosyltransferase involved in cell wall biosynthesis
MKKILFIVNVDWFFISHRLPIALAAIKQGYEVHLACRLTDKKKSLEKLGIHVHSLNLTRGNINILGEFKILKQLFFIFKLVKPDLVHLITVKPILLGGILARIFKTPAVVISFSGLGLVFKNKKSNKIISLLFYLALSNKNQKIIFQNNHDRLNISKIKSEAYVESEIIKGSGVDLSLFSTVENKETSNLMVMMASRFLYSKGVREFVEAAKIITKENKKIRFVLVGDVDLANPDSISKLELQKWKSESFMEIWGYQNNMHKIIQKCDIFVFPSYYGEGLPKVLIEAAACGIAIITTDHPGCRDAVEPSSGILIPIQNHLALIKAIVSLIENPKKIKKMGMSGRRLAEREFDIKNVVDRHIGIYSELFSKI